MRKKDSLLVFSIYSNVLGNYPYYPFVASNIGSGIVKYLNFIESREAICEGAELHIIGTCRFDKSTSDLSDIQPYLVPQRVEIKDNCFSKLIILSEFYMNKLSKYLKVLKERMFYGKKGN